MRTIDIDKLAAPLSTQAASGEDVEGSRDFLALEQAIQGKPERQMGDAKLSAEPPDWPEVARLALALLERTKHLQLYLYLARAQLHLHSFVGFSDAVELMRIVVEQYWDSLYPRLDPEDNLDPTARINAIVGLNHMTTQLQIRGAALISSRAFGTVTLKDIAIASGQLPALKNGPTPLDKATIESAFLDGSVEELQANAQAIEASIANIIRLEAILTQKVGAARSAGLGDLLARLREAQRALAPRLEARGLDSAVPGAPSKAEHPPAGAGSVTAVNGAASAGSAAKGAPAANGYIVTRDDVIRMLDQLCAYYDRHEPSSPVPLLLKRAKKLVPMTFVEVIQDMMPDVMATVDKLRGAAGGTGTAAPNAAAKQ